MSKQAHNNQSKHNKDTKVVLQEMQEARKAAQSIKAELMEHNNIVKLHADHDKTTDLPDTENNTPYPVISVIRKPADSAPQEIRYDDEKHSSASRDMHKYLFSMQEEYIATAGLWLELPFQIASVFFQKRENGTDTKQPLPQINSDLA